MQEVVQSDNCKTLLCFICSSKHVYYHGLDAFGQEYNAGCIDYRNSDLDRGRLRSIFASGREEDSFFAANLSAKRFKKKRKTRIYSGKGAWNGGATWRSEEKSMVKRCAIHRMLFDPANVCMTPLIRYVLPAPFLFATSAGSMPPEMRTSRKHCATITSLAIFAIFSWSIV